MLEPCLAIASLALDMSEQELAEHWLAEAGIVSEEVVCCGIQIRTRLQQIVYREILQGNFGWQDIYLEEERMFQSFCK